MILKDKYLDTEILEYSFHRRTLWVNYIFQTQTTNTKPYLWKHDIWLVATLFDIIIVATQFDRSD